MLVESESQVCQQGLEGKIEAPKSAWRTGCQPERQGRQARQGLEGATGQRGQRASRVTSGATNASRGVREPSDF